MANEEDAHQGTGALSRRELQVALLAAGDLSDRQIASRLGISPRTVEAHLHQCYRKTGTENRVQLMLWVNQSAITLL